MIRTGGLAAVVIGASVVAIAASGGKAAPEPSLRELASSFVRPEGIPAGLGSSDAAVELGRALFADTRLSGDGAMSCATCHQPELGFADGQSLRTGRDGKPLGRHTPHLWNLAWAETLFWDGRAKTLEHQASGPIESPVEMGGSVAVAVDRLKADAAMVAAFARAFPAAPEVSPANLTAALAAYERTLVSPVTRFDRWVGGEEAALTAEEKAGFALFVGKAECVSCHSGWRFTDEGFHDIGLPDKGDRGRGKVLGLAAADHGFKTPSLRELAWTAPYMHDGSLASLEDVVAHYAEGVVRRPTLSKDMPAVSALTAEERAQLVAFLGTLSSEDAPRPPQTVAKVEVAGGGEPAVPARSVGQKGKRFSPGHVTLAAGESLTILNDDKRTHNVRIDDTRMVFTSNAQEPGDSVIIPFNEAGEFAVICSIHPAMHLQVTVTPKAGGGSAGGR